jgi:hypothetical protein
VVLPEYLAADQQQKQPAAAAKTKTVPTEVRAVVDRAVPEKAKHNIEQTVV